MRDPAHARVRALFAEARSRLPRGGPLEVEFTIGAARIAARRLHDEGGPDLAVADVLAVTEDLWAAGR